MLSGVGRGAPFLFRRQSLPGARRGRRRFALFVDPAAAAIPINPDAREIEDALEVRRVDDLGRERRNRRIARRTGRRADEQDLSPGECGKKIGMRTRRVESIGLDALLAQHFRRPAIAGDAARLQIRVARYEAPRAVSQAKAENPHPGSVAAHRSSGPHQASALGCFQGRRRGGERRREEKAL